jgi:uncharacterized protein YeaO (DUF488 family)
MIRTKSVHSPIDRKDGLRILATRFRGRGLPANRYDVWMPNLAPSEDLLYAARNNRITWAEFSRRYGKELREGGSIDKRSAHIKNYGQQDPDLTVPAIASQERLTIGYLSRLLRLPTLAPDITTAIINSKHPAQLSAKQLMRLALRLPTDWAEQRKILGF